MTDSLATGQRSLGDPDETFPLWPPIVDGCPATSTDDVQYPLEVTYDYDAVDPALFDQPPLPGLDRWAPLLPPLADGVDLGAGGTRLVAASDLTGTVGFDGALYLKDESANPTWSHKDRLAAPTVGAAVARDAPGVVVSSTGNHGASVAAHAARADLPCVVFTSRDLPDSMARFLDAYGAAVARVPRDRRWECMRRVRDELGYVPTSNLTPTHTGHPFGPEGYKTIAYEIHAQLDGVPGSVLVPTGYAELLYGVWKGFRELRELGVVDRAPEMVACEPAARAPLSAALEADAPAVTVDAAPTDASSIGVTVNGYRGVQAVRESGGRAYALPDAAIERAQERLAAVGYWQELSGAAGVAGLAAAVAADDDPLPGPAVAICCSSGFKDPRGDVAVPDLDPDAIVADLTAEYGLGPDGDGPGV